MGQVGHLNGIQEDFDGKGLTILSVTGQEKGVVDEFVDKYEPLYPILCKAQSGAYSTGGVPSAYLIGPSGDVLWQGHPGKLSDDDIEDALKDVEKVNRVSTWSFMISAQLPDVPAAMTGVKKLLEKMKFGAALKKAEGALGKLEGDEKILGETVRDWIAKGGETGIDAAAGLVRDGEIYKAYLRYQTIVERYKGHELSKQAKSAAGDLKKGKETKLEFKASEKFEKIKVEMRSEKKAEDKLDLLKPILSKKYRDTLAGKQAAEMAVELEKRAGK